MWQCDANFQRSQTVALIQMAADNVFTSVFLSRIQSPDATEGTRAMKRIVGTGAVQLFSNEESGRQLKRMGFHARKLSVAMMMTKMKKLSDCDFMRLTDCG